MSRHITKAAIDFEDAMFEYLADFIFHNWYQKHMTTLNFLAYVKARAAN